MKKILIQLDTDPQPSVFDRVTAIDAGVDEIFAYGGVTLENVTALIHGAMFTRGPADLKNTAVFIGGSDVAAGDALLKKVESLFFGPLRVSVMMDSNGSNTTAAAAVRAAGRHLDLAGAKALILGGTGPVGHRAAQLLAGAGAEVLVSSRTVDRAEATCAAIRQALPKAIGTLRGQAVSQLAESAHTVTLVIAAGAAGVQFSKADQWQSFPNLRVAIDLNAVSPVGLEGLAITAKGIVQPPTGSRLHDLFCYGALGVGGEKMKLHKTAVARLFESNSQILRTESIYEIARAMG